MAQDRKPRRCYSKRWETAKRREIAASERHVRNLEGYVRACEALAPFYVGEALKMLDDEVRRMHLLIQSESKWSFV